MTVSIGLNVDRSADCLLLVGLGECTVCMGLNDLERSVRMSSPDATRS